MGHRRGGVGCRISISRVAPFRRAGLGLAIAAGIGFTALPAAAQVAGSLGLGASLIEYDGFLTAGAAVVAPTLRFDSPALTFAAQGSWTRFETGNGVVQGTIGGGWLAGSADWWRLEISGSGGASRYVDDPVSGHLLGGARLHLFGQRTGAWVGAAGGRLLGGRSAVPVEVSVAGWHVRRRVALVGTATVSAVDKTSYLDLAGALRWTAGKVEIEARIGARPSARAGNEAGDPFVGGYGELIAQVSLGERLALTLGGGTYPSDPVRRVVGGRYLNAGIRILAIGGATPPARFVRPPSTRPVPPAETNTTPRLELTQLKEQFRIRIHVAGAASVELMADFTDWEPIVLKHVVTGVWEIALNIPSGAHRLNIRIGDGPWVTPTGLRVEPTEFGGTTGILIVP